MTFSTTHKLNQTLALLLQLPGNTDLIPLVLAPTDAGKTSLWQQLCSKAPGHWRLAALSAHQKMTRVQLMRALVNDWLPGKTEISHSQLLLELKQLQTQGLLPVLALDDADQLSLELLQLLRQLPVSLIFFAEQPPGGVEDNYQVLPLSPWNREEVAAFVRHLRQLVPSDWELDRLITASQGLPGQLIKLLDGPAPAAASNLAQPTAATPPQAKAASPAKRVARLNLWLGLVAIILLLALGYAFNKRQIDQGLSKLSERLTDTQPADLTPGLLLPESRPAPDQAPNQAAAPPKWPPAPVPETESSNPDPAATPEAKTPDEAETKTPDTQDQTTADSEPTTEHSAQPEPSPAVPKAKDKESLIHGPEWLLQQSSSLYGMEVVELTSLDALDAYVKKHQLSGSVPLSWLATKGKNKGGFLLVLGNYPSQQTAAKARLMLPDSINIDKVKVRSFEELHKQIKR